MHGGSVPRHGEVQPKQRAPSAIFCENVLGAVGAVAVVALIVAALVVAALVVAALVVATTVVVVAALAAVVVACSLMYGSPNAASLSRPAKLLRCSGSVRWDLAKRVVMHTLTG